MIWPVSSYINRLSEYIFIYVYKRQKNAIIVGWSYKRNIYEVGAKQ